VQPSDPDEGRRPADAGAALTAFLDLDDLLRRSVAYACESAGTRAGRILLHDPEAHEFVVAAASDDTPDTRGRRFPDRGGVLGAVLTSGKAQISTEGGPASIAAPLAFNDRTIGVVEAVARVGGGSFGAGDLERFTSCCSLIAIALENASLYRRLDKETEINKRSLDDQARPLIADSAAMRHALAQAERAAAGRSTILLVGETGTGKEQVARTIHERSPRASAPFVAINCGALPEGLLESELFGHEKGAFTGADGRHIGRFELADGGTLFLDEIGELPPAAQVKLLRVLQEREISRVGGAQPIRVNVRLIAATHRDLGEEVQQGRFREDLFFRVHVIPIALPPLRERLEDIEPMMQFFLRRFAAELGRSPRAVTDAGLMRLRAHRWPGNVRELENLAERLLVLGGDQAIDAGELDGLLPRTAPAQAAPAAAPPIDDLSLWEREHALLVQALERAGGNQSEAARLMKISREQLRTRMRRYGLLPKD
jgi:transcriptional regulator with GAF, ATPase, and Fis domain